MTRHRLLAAAAAACYLGAGLLCPPNGFVLREFAAWFVRPATLPFAWSALAEARQNGNAVEMFARARQILHLLPTWTDGYSAFACSFALDEALATTQALRAQRAHQRLMVALAWLEDARASAGRRESELLQTMAFLPELAVRQEPGLEALLPPGGAAAMADRYLAEAEVLDPHGAVREQRTFRGPGLAAGFLASGDRQRALLVLDAAIARSTDVRDQALAAEWRQRLIEVCRHLRGEASVDLGAVHSDPRMAPLLPYLR
ncbi:MAG TPA: hypothetical protein VFD82_24070 [Planctomycetota bacterium]|nr:hypothetical protein [Planctomycetota bacterium]